MDKQCCEGDTIVKRKSIPKKTQLFVWKHDGWICQYCNQPVFFNPTFELFEELSPNHGYYHRNGKREKRYEFIEKKMASVDHVLPKKHGGPDSSENYVTACWGCNHQYGEKTVQNGKPEPKSLLDKKPVEYKWDGFSSLYPKLRKLMGKKKDDWTRLLENE